MGMLAGLLGGSSAAAGGSAAGAGAGAGAAGTAGAASATAPTMGSKALGLLRQAGQNQVKSIENQQPAPPQNPGDGRSGLEGLYNVQTAAPQMQGQVAPVLSPDELLRNRDLSIGGGYGRT